MKIIVSGNVKEYQEGTNVAQLMRAENIEMPLYVTVAVNDGFVPVEERESRVLKDGDAVEFLYYMGGGR